MVQNGSKVLTFNLGFGVKFPLLPHVGAVHPDWVKQCGAKIATITGVDGGYIYRWGSKDQIANL